MEGAHRHFLLLRILFLYKQLRNILFIKSSYELHSMLLRGACKSATLVISQYFFQEILCYYIYLYPPPPSLLCYYVVYFNYVQLQLWSSGAVPSGLNELDIVLQRSEDAQELSHLLPDLEYLVDKKLEGLSDQGKS